MAELKNAPVSIDQKEAQRLMALGATGSRPFTVGDQTGFAAQFGGDKDNEFFQFQTDQEAFDFINMVRKSAAGGDRTIPAQSGPSDLIEKDKELEPPPFEAGATPEKLQEIASIAIDQGDFDLADRAINLALKQSQLQQSFKTDLSPEAITADTLRGFAERRLGGPQTNQLTKSGKFGGESRNPFDIEQGLKGQEFSQLSSLERLKQAGRAQKFSEKKFVELHRLKLTQIKQEIRSYENSKSQTAKTTALQRLNILRTSAIENFKNSAELAVSEQDPKRKKAARNLLDKAIDAVDKTGVLTREEIENQIRSE